MDRNQLIQQLAGMMGSGQNPMSGLQMNPSPYGGLLGEYEYGDQTGFGLPTEPQGLLASPADNFNGQDFLADRQSKIAAFLQNQTAENAAATPEVGGGPGINMQIYPGGDSDPLYKFHESGKGGYDNAAAYANYMQQGVDRDERLRQYTADMAYNNQGGR